MKLLFAGTLSYKNANHIKVREQELNDNFLSENRVKDKSALRYINLFV